MLPFNLLLNKDERIACVLTIIMFLQINATLFDDAVFSWKDQYLLTYIYQFSDYIHLFDAVENSESATYYLIMYCSCKFYISNNFFSN
jgi:hypothetical protein